MLYSGQSASALSHSTQYLTSDFSAVLRPAFRANDVVVLVSRLNAPRRHVVSLVNGKPLSAAHTRNRVKTSETRDAQDTRGVARASARK